VYWGRGFIFFFLSFCILYHIALSKKILKVNLILGWVVTEFVKMIINAFCPPLFFHWYVMGEIKALEIRFVLIKAYLVDIWWSQYCIEAKKKVSFSGPKRKIGKKVNQCPLKSSWILFSTSYENSGPSMWQFIRVNESTLYLESWVETLI